jgi:uncharacterized membrane protein YkoI
MTRSAPMNRFATIAAIASITTFVGCASMREEEGENEVTVTMNEVPAVVRASLEHESVGGKITEIERETKDGKTVYSADIELSGVTWDITVAEDGRVLSREKE